MFSFIFIEDNFPNVLTGVKNTESSSWYIKYLSLFCDCSPSHIVLLTISPFHHSEKLVSYIVKQLSLQFLASKTPRSLHFTILVSKLLFNDRGTLAHSKLRPLLSWKYIKLTHHWESGLSGGTSP